MLKDKSALFDDMAKLAGGAAGMVAHLQQQIRSDIKARVEELADRMDLVPREDLDRVQAQLNDALKTLTSLEDRVTALEEAKNSDQKKKK